MSTTSSTLKTSELVFEKASVSNNSSLSLPIENPYFGIFKLEANKFEFYDKIYEIIFTIDRSGSMSDLCEDGRTKQQHIAHTLKNMIWFFHDHPHIRAKVSIFVFDTKVELILNSEMITIVNVNDIIQQIDKIRPQDSTNIELALQKVDSFIQAGGFLENSEVLVSHVLMTDGDATVGEMQPHLLKEMVNNSYANIFVGFGIDHNDAILNEISSQSRSAYYFIDKLENSGLVYGEILHSLIYKLLIDVKLTIKNGLLYNFKTNEWVSEMHVEDIVSEAKKDFHLISETPSDCVVDMSALTFDSSSPFQHSIANAVFEDNLKCYVFRQKTIQLLFEVKQFYSEKENVKLHDVGLGVGLGLGLGLGVGVGAFRFKNNYNRQRLYDIENDKMSAIKDKMKQLMEEMKTFMRENDLENDNFMKNLCDDIFVCHRTFGTSYCGMYTGARLTSQGTQRCYTVSDTPRTHFNFNDGVDDEFQMHTISQFENMPYLTPSALRVMRTVSDGSNTDELDDEPISLYLSSDESIRNNFV